MRPAPVMRVSLGPVPEAGRRILARRKELELTQKDVTERCNGAATTVFKGEGWGWKDEKEPTWLSKVERGRARWLQPVELRVLAHVLQWPPEAIAGPEALKHGVTWDPFCDEDYSRDVFEMMKVYGSNSKELWGWASFLPCSLEHEDFMHEHHLSFFRDMPEPFRTTAVEKYDRIGNMRRRQVIDGAASRPYVFHHFMRLGDLIEIVEAQGDYVGFSKELRLACLARLREIISKPSYKVHLTIAVDEDVNDIARFFEDFDSRIIFDDQFMVCRERVGNLHITTNNTIVNLYRHALIVFREQSAYRSDKDLDELMALLYDLTRAVKSCAA